MLVWQTTLLLFLKLMVQLKSAVADVVSGLPRDLDLQ